MFQKIRYQITATFADYQEPDMAGYSVTDYFRDRGACLDREFGSETEAKAEITAQYLGPDADGIAPTVEVIKT